MAKGAPGLPGFDDALADIVHSFEASPGRKAVRRSTPGTDGAVRIVGTIHKTSPEAEARFRVLVDGREIWSRRLERTGCIGHGVDILALELTRASTVDFLVVAEPESCPVQVAAAFQIVAEPHVSRWRVDLPGGFPSIPESEQQVQRRRGQKVLQQIRKASADKRGRIVIPPGDYRFRANWSRESTLKNLADLEIDADGATFWFEPPMVHGLLFANCRNVTLRGLDIDFAVPIWFQARVDHIDRRQGTVRAILMDGYAPRDADGKEEQSGERMFIFYDADGRFVNHGPSPGKWRLAEDGRGIVCSDVARYGIPDALKPGGYVVGTIRTGAALRSKNCAGMRFEDVNVWSSPGVAVYEGGGAGGNTYLRVRATRRPRTNRLHAFGADVFHMAATDRGPILDRCESAYSSDDNLNIHGDFGRVVERVDDCRYYLQGEYAPGDALEFRDQRSVALLGRAKVVSAEKAPDGPSLAINEKYKAKGEWLVEQDASLKLPALSLVVMDGKRSSQAWVVRNCWFHSNFQRTLINGSPGGLFENTTLQNVGMGIRVQFETWGPWMEGPFARDLVIRGNRFIDSPPSGPAISVSMHPPGGGSNRRRFEAAPVTNLTISANYFGRTEGAPVSIHNVDGLRIHGNSIERSSQTPDPSTVDRDWLYLQDCSNVSVGENLALSKAEPTVAGNETGKSDDE